MTHDRDWDIRRYVYREFALTAAPPNHASIAHAFGVTEVEARESLRRLHEAHAIFLRPGSDDVLMANPFSAVATDYSVHIGETRYFANCAWDSLGIAAALNCDADITARHPLDGEAMRYGVVYDELVGEMSGLVHFAKPFRNWYDDLVDT